MFTGIVARRALIHSVEARQTGSRLRVAARGEASIDGVGDPWEDLQPGESVAVGGCCLTLIEGSDRAGTPLGFDVVEETLRRTTLGSLQVGDAINLERALRVGDRLGGHYVTGHIDTIGTVQAFDRGGGEVILTIGHGPDAPFRTVEKGSVAVDGVSLTVASRSPKSFTVVLVPHTLAVTTLGELVEGDVVNLEMDHFGRWVLAWLAGNEETAPGGEFR